MPLYVFKTQDGCFVQKLFSKNECPKQLILQDGRIAKKTITCPNITNSQDSKQRIKKQQTKKNIEAGNRGRSYWKKQIGGMQ